MVLAVSFTGVDMTETISIFNINGTDEVYCAIGDEINPRCQKAKMFVEDLWGKTHKYLDWN